MNSIDPSNGNVANHRGIEVLLATMTCYGNVTIYVYTHIALAYSGVASAAEPEMLMWPAKISRSLLGLAMVIFSITDGDRSFRANTGRDGRRIEHCISDYEAGWGSLRAGNEGRR